MHWTINPKLPYEAKEERRQFLYFYGILSCTASFAFFAVACILRQYFRQDIPPLAGAKQFPGVGGYEATLRRYINRWKWRLGQFVWRKKPRLGTWQLWIGILLGFLWMGWLSVTQTKEDFFHLTKRFGRISAALLPMQYFLSSKALLQILVRFTGTSHEQLNVVHRWLGRLITFFLALHGAYYTYYFVTWNRLDRAFKLDSIIGITMLSILIAMGVTSLPRFREKKYRLFYAIHFIGACAIPILAWFHVKHLRPYVLASADIFIADKALRLLRVAGGTARVERITEDVVQVDVSLASSSSQRFAKAVPGMHVYLCVPHISSTRFHPFTIAGTSADGRKIRIVARKLDGFTRLLHGQRISKDFAVKCDGPYGAAEAFPKLNHFGSVVLIAGGIGATFTWPIWLSLFRQPVVVDVDDSPETGLTAGSQARGARPGKKDRFIWSVKRPEDVKWVSRSDPSFRDELVSEESSTGEDNYQCRLELFVTGHYAPALTTNHEVEMSEALVGGAGARRDVETEPARKGIEATVEIGRPNINAIIRTSVVSCKRSGSSLAILVCGPPDMGYDAKAAVDAEVDGSDEATAPVWFWCEDFGW